MQARVHLAVVVLTVLAVVVACAPAAPTVAPTKPPAPAATTAPAAPTAAPKAEPAATTKPAAPTAAPVSKIKRGGTLTVAYIINTYSLDPHINPGTGAVFPNEQMFDMLVRAVYNAEAKKLEIVPELATSWEAKGKEIVMKLRPGVKGVKFTDGSEWNARVAKWNLDRAMTHPKSSQKPKLETIASVDAVDDYTIKLNLKEPSAATIPMLTQDIYMGSQAAEARLGEEAYLANPVGTGAFKLKEWVRDVHVVMERNENYWQMGQDGKPLPYLDTVKYRYIPDQSIAYLELKAGSVDVMRAEPKDVTSIKATPELVYWEHDWTGFQYRLIGYAGKSPFSEVKLRQALCYATDREALAKTIAPGVGFPVPYFWSPVDLGYNDKLPKYQYDLEKAKGLVKEAGYPAGLDVKLTIFARAVDQRAAEALQSMWNKAGFRVTIDAQEKVAATATMRAGNIDAMFGMTTYGVIDPDQHISWLVLGGTTNHDNLNDPEINKWMEAGRSTYDQKQRQEAYENVQRVIYEKAYRCTSFVTPQNITLRKYVKGLKTSVDLERSQAREVWLDK